MTHKANTPPSETFGAGTYTFRVYDAREGGLFDGCLIMVTAIVKISPTNPKKFFASLYGPEQQLIGTGIRDGECAISAIVPACREFQLAILSDIRQVTKQSI